MTRPDARLPGEDPAAERQAAERGSAAARFRLTLARVMLVQLVTLALLGILQARYTP